MKFLKLILALVITFSVMKGFSQTTKTTPKAKTTTKTTTTKTSSKQTAGKSTSITDEDLKKYAMTMDSIQGMQETLTQIIAENVQKNTVMSVARYNQIFKLAGDQAKLQAANATPEEMEFLKQIDSLKSYNLARINDTYKALAKDYVGLKVFNQIRKSLESDSALKERYEAIHQEVASGNKPENKASGE